MASRMTGDKRLRRTLRRVEPSTGRRVAEAVQETAEAIRQDAIARAPVDEGDLIRSIEAKAGRDGLTYVIGPGAKSVSISKNPYRQAALGIRSRTKRSRYWQFFKGVWIEFGTSKMPARPFMQPAFDLNKRFGMTRIQAAIRRALSDASEGR